MLAVEQIFNEISPMKPIEKIKLVDKILSSINQHHDNIDKTWSDEAEARIIAYDSGDIITINQKDVFSKYKI